jgi:hypothetical protein
MQVSSLAMDSLIGVKESAVTAEYSTVDAGA